MTDRFTAVAANTILYCRNWSATVEFYRDRLALPVTFANDWFIEFRLTAGAFVSVADERRARVNSGGGAGITLALQVTDADAVWQQLQQAGVQPEPVRDHPWGARAFYLFDPEGHRLEVWSPLAGVPAGC